MVFAGILISVVATVGLFGELLTSLPSHRNRVISYTTSLVVVIGFLLILIGVIGAPLNNRTELEKLNNCVTKDFATGANLYLYNSTNPTMNKYCSNLKGAPGAKINYTNPKVFSGTVLFLAGIFGVAKIIKPRKN